MKDEVKDEVKDGIKQEGQCGRKYRVKYTQH
jgi:hypothetical protein